MIRAGRFPRSAGTLSPRFIGGGVAALRKRGSSHSSSGAPNSAVAAPVGISRHTCVTPIIT